MIRSYEYCTLPDGRTVTAYEITNSYGEAAVILNYGAAIAQLRVFDNKGRISDVVLGADMGQDVSGASYVGSVMGRCGNRIANAAFEINGKQFRLTPTEGPHHLHGAGGNWARQLFTARTGDNFVILNHYDEGSDGWDCGAEVSIKYTFDDFHALTIEYTVRALGDTVISPTNHAYFNLNMPEDVLNTKMQIFTRSYAPKSPLHMPDGSTATVEGTPLDFTVSRSLAQALSQGAEDFFPEYQRSFDDFYVMPGKGYKKVAQAVNEDSGRVMSVFSDAQGLILYTPAWRFFFSA